MHLVQPLRLAQSLLRYLLLKGSRNSCHTEIWIPSLLNCIPLSIEMVVPGACLPSRVCFRAEDPDTDDLSVVLVLYQQRASQLRAAQHLLPTSADYKPGLELGDYFYLLALARYVQLKVTCLLHNPSWFQISNQKMCCCLLFLAAKWENHVSVLLPVSPGFLLDLFSICTQIKPLKSVGDRI